jgi:group I intron endonuclease
MKVYVGITNKLLARRWSNHRAQAKHGSHYHFHRALRKYPTEVWQLDILESDLSETDAKQAEIRWILVLDSFNPRKGYNRTLGGDGCSRPYKKRGPHSDATKTKMSLAQKGRSLSSEHRANLRGPRGPLSDAHRQAIRDAKAKRPQKHTEEAKAKIRATKASKPYRHSEEVRLKMSIRAKERYARNREAERDVA